MSNQDLPPAQAQSAPARPELGLPRPLPIGPSSLHFFCFVLSRPDQGPVYSDLWFVQHAIVTGVFSNNGVFKVRRRTGLICTPNGYPNKAVVV